MLTTDQIKEAADRHGLISVSCSLLADLGKFSVGVQWMNHSYRECTSGIDADPQNALAIALSEKAKIDNRTSDERAERAARLRAELEALELAA